MENNEKHFKEILKDVKRFFLGIFFSFMMFLIAVFVVASIYSCGARKAEKNKIKEETERKEKIVLENDITSIDNITITSKSFVIDSTKEIITTKTYKPIDLKLPATFTDSKGNKQELNNTEYTESEIKRNKAFLETKNKNSSYDIKTQDKSKKTSEKEEKGIKNEKGKKSEREQFDIIGIIMQHWWLWLIILLVLWLFKKYKSKINFS